MSKKVYVSARAKYRADEVAEVQRKLQKIGYEVMYDWPSGNTKIAKPYRNSKNRKVNLPAMTKMLRAAADADIFILMDSEGLRGVYIEYGAFLKAALDSPQNRQAYIVGPNSHEREHVFESPPFVHFVDDIEEVYEHLAND